MNHWDWIQWYYGIVWVAMLIGSMLLDGHDRSNYDVKNHIINCALMMPFTGRIMGWW